MDKRICKKRATAVWQSPFFMMFAHIAQCVHSKLRQNTSIGKPNTMVLQKAKPIGAICMQHFIFSSHTDTQVAGHTAQVYKAEFLVST